MDLRKILAEWRLNQAELARVLEVTTRTVSAWVTESDRELPGPVKAYLRLMMSLNNEAREMELSKFRTKEEKMENGMFAISLLGSADRGSAIVIFNNGIIYGADEGGVKYDGTYLYNPESNTFDIKVKVVIPPHTPTIMGKNFPYEWSFDITAAFPTNLQSHKFDVLTPAGKVQAEISYVRAIPLAA